MFFNRSDNPANIQCFSVAVITLLVFNVAQLNPMAMTAGNIRISNQFVITRALHLQNKRIIKQASLSHWVTEYNLKVSSA